MSIKIRSTNLRSVTLSASGSPPPSPPVASFTYTPTSGTIPLSVDFTDTSSNTPTSWAWDFGDGNTSTSQNPSHSYTIADTYTVSLTATNAGGSSSPVTHDVIANGVPGTPTFTLHTTDATISQTYNNPSGPPFHGITGVLNSALSTNGTQPSSLEANFTTGTGTMVGGTFSHSPFFSWVMETVIGPTVTGSKRIIGIYNTGDVAFDTNVEGGTPNATWFAEDGSAFIDGVFYPVGQFTSWTTGDVMAIAVDFNSSLTVFFKNGAQIFDLQTTYSSNTHNTTYTVGSIVPAVITISQLDFTAYSGSTFIVQEKPAGAPSFPSIPYTWNPSTDLQVVLNPGENITVQVTMSGYTGAVTGTSFTTPDGEYQISATGQTGNIYEFDVTNLFGSPSTVPEDLTFTVTDSVGAVGTYTITITDIFT